MLAKVAAQSSSSTETEALCADDIADHGLPSALAQLLRTARHLPGAVDGCDDGSRVAHQRFRLERAHRATPRVAAFVEDRVTALELGSDRSCFPISFSVFGSAAAAKGSPRSPDSRAGIKRAGLSERTIKTSKTARSHRRVTRCFGS